MVAAGSATEEAAEWGKEESAAEAAGSGSVEGSGWAAGWEAAEVGEEEAASAEKGGSSSRRPSSRWCSGRRRSAWEAREGAAARARWAETEEGSASEALRTPPSPPSRRSAWTAHRQLWPTCRRRCCPLRMRLCWAAPRQASPPGSPAAQQLPAAARKLPHTQSSACPLCLRSGRAR